MESEIKICGVKYHIYGPIGKGGSGIVYLARSLESQELVAVKMIRDYDNPIVHSTVNNQIQIQKKFANNPYVIQFIGMQSIKKLVYIVFEAGMCSLRNVIEFKETHEKQFLHIAGNLCNALLSVHQEGLIHRDIKPQNVILKNGIYKITDFGTTCSKPQKNEVVGTIGYWAPEILFQTHTATQKVDVWSMGVTLFQILFKINPFLHYKKEQSFFSVKKEIEKNISHLTHPRFSFEKLLSHLKASNLEQEVKYIEKKMKKVRVQILNAFPLFFQVFPHKREDISYFHLLFESIRVSVPMHASEQVKIRGKHNDNTIPPEIKIMIKASNLLYELDSHHKSPFSDQAICSLELSIMFFSVVHKDNFIILKNAQLKNHEKEDEQVYRQIREGILAYYFWMLEQGEDVAEYEKFNELKMHLLVCANWNAINHCKEFCELVKKITDFEISHPIEILQLVQMCSDRSLQEIEEAIFLRFMDPS